MSSSTPRRSIVRCATLLGAVCLAAIALEAPTAFAQADQQPDQQAGPTTAPTTAPSADVTVNIDTLGDAHVEVTAANVAQLVDPVKMTGTEISEIILHQFKLDQNYYAPQSLTSSLQTDGTGYTIDYTLAGLAHPTGEASSWKALLLANMMNAVINVTDHQVNMKATTADEPVQSLTVTLPTGTTNIATSDDARYATFTMAARDIPTGTNTSVNFQLEARPRVMSCLAKSCAYERFPQLWVGRSTFTNTGTAPLKEYWVRYHVEDYTDNWSAWHHYQGPILPGQTIVDPYFPIFDVPKMAAIEGTRPAQLDAEYDYQNADGKVIPSTTSQNLEILDHNDVIGEENCMELVLPSFVTKDDRLIRQVESMVCAQMPHELNTLSNAGAMEFMRQLYRFMLHNHIVYQGPAMDGDLQHIKYGRDVVMDRAGTCIDLAIFYASVCEAAGLQPVMYLPPGHCFPAICLPGRDEKGNVIDAPIIPVETTLVRNTTTVFEDAVASGLDEQKTLLNSHQGQVVDVAEMRAINVHSFELQPLPVNTLGALGIEGAPEARNIAGCWESSFSDSNGVPVNVETEFEGDSKAKLAVEAGDGSPIKFMEGLCVYDGSTFLFQSDKFSARASITWVDDNHFVWKWISCDDARLEGLSLPGHREQTQSLSFISCMLNIPLPKAPQFVPSFLSLPVGTVKAASESELSRAFPGLGKVVHYDLEVENAVNTACVATLRFTDAQGNPLCSANGTPISKTWSLMPPYQNTEYNGLTFSLDFSNITRPLSQFGTLVYYKLEIHRVSDGALIGGDTQQHTFWVY